MSTTIGHVDRCVMTHCGGRCDAGGLPGSLLRADRRALDRLGLAAAEAALSLSAVAHGRREAAVEGRADMVTAAPQQAKAKRVLSLSRNMQRRVLSLLKRSISKLETSSTLLVVCLLHALLAVGVRVRCGGRGADTTYVNSTREINALHESC